MWGGLHLIIIPPTLHPGAQSFRQAVIWGGKDIFQTACTLCSWLIPLVPLKLPSQLAAAEWETEREDWQRMMCHHMQPWELSVRWFLIKNNSYLSSVSAPRQSGQSHSGSRINQKTHHLCTEPFGLKTNHNTEYIRSALNSPLCNKIGFTFLIHGHWNVVNRLELHTWISEHLQLQRGQREALKAWKVELTDGYRDNNKL